MIQKHKTLFLLGLIGLALTVREKAFVSAQEPLSASAHYLSLNPTTKTPHRIVGKFKINSTDLSKLNQLVSTPILSTEKFGTIAQNFVLEHKDLLKITDIRSLELASVIKVKPGLYTVNFTQQKNGIPIIGAAVTLRMTDKGNVPLIGSDYHPNVNIDTRPQISPEQALAMAQSDVQFDLYDKITQAPRLFILPLEQSGQYALVYHIAIFKEDPLAEWEFLIDAQTKEILRKRNRIKSYEVNGEIHGLILPRKYDNERQEKPLANETVTLENVGETVTDKDGRFSFLNIPTPGPYKLTVGLKGPYVNVQESPNLEKISNGEPAAFLWHDTTYQVLSDRILMDFQDKLNEFYHINRVHDYIVKELGHDEIDRVLPNGIKVQRHNQVTGANLTDMYFQQTKGLSSATIYHEYGHVTLFALEAFAQLPPFSFVGDAHHEGFGDYLACTMNNDPLTGGVTEAGQTRRCDTNLTFADVGGEEIHAAGQPWSGIFWDLRQALVARYGYPAGAIKADRLIYESHLSYALTDSNSILLEFLIVDDADSDNDLTNGSPHFKEIISAFAKRGLTYIGNFTKFDDFIRVDDDLNGRSLGNGNGAIEPGEAAELQVTVRNNTNNVLSNLHFNLVSVDKKISVIAEAVSLPEIPPLGQQEITFVVKAPVQLEFFTPLHFAVSSTFTVEMGPDAVVVTNLAPVKLVSNMSKKRIVKPDGTTIPRIDSIFNDKIVYSDSRNGNQDVFLYNLSSQTEYLISDLPQNQTIPFIQGHKVAWVQPNSDATGFEIQARDIDSQTGAPEEKDYLVYESAFGIKNLTFFDNLFAWKEDHPPAVDGPIIVLNFNPETRQGEILYNFFGRLPAVYERHLILGPGVGVYNLDDRDLGFGQGSDSSGHSISHDKIMYLGRRGGMDVMLQQFDPEISQPVGEPINLTPYPGQTRASLDSDNWTKNPSVFEDTYVWQDYNGYNIYYYSSAENKKVSLRNAPGQERPLAYDHRIVWSATDGAWEATLYKNFVPTNVFVRGDTNGDREVDVSDAITTLLYLFNGQPIGNCNALDFNDDGIIDISDPIALLQFLFKGGNGPPGPFPQPGEDTTPSDLVCHD